MLRSPLIVGILLLAVLALAGWAAAFWLVGLWTDQVVAGEERVLEAQAESLGRALESRLEREMAIFVERRLGRPDASWTREFADVFDTVARSPDSALGLVPRGIELIDPTHADRLAGGVVRAHGRQVPHLEPDRRLRAGDLDLAFEHHGEITRVAVEGKIDPPREAPPRLTDAATAYRFRALFELRSLRAAAVSARSWATWLVIAYWLSIYVAFVTLFVFVRRQEGVARRAEERKTRLDAMTSVAEGIAHEVRNPLNGIALNLQYLEKLQAKGGRADREDFLRVQEELHKIQTVVDNFVCFSRLRDLELEALDLDAVIDHALADLDALRADVGARVTRVRADDARMRGDALKLRQAMRNVLQNALEGGASVAEPQVGVVVEASRDRLVVAITNDGPPVSQEVLDAMFDPFFTTRSSAIGLGLTLARTIVEAHAGRMHARARTGGGCTVIVDLPRGR